MESVTFKLARAGDPQKMTIALAKLGFTSNGGWGQDSEFVIQFNKTAPEHTIFDALEPDLFDLHRDFSWYLHNVSDAGITLYFATLNAGDGYIFIPFASVACVHSATDSVIEKIRKLVKERNKVSDATREMLEEAEGEPDR